MQQPACSCRLMAMATVLMVASTCAWAQDVLPTMILRQPIDNTLRNRSHLVYGNKIYVNKQSKVELPCVASGSGEAAPTYFWKYNGVYLNSSVIIDQREILSYSPKTGTLTFNSFDSRSNGAYQCFAANGPDNQYVAVSDVVTLAQVTYPTVFGNKACVPAPAYVGEYRKFTCMLNTPAFDPPGTVSWVDAAGKSVMNDRLVIDPAGDLHVVAVAEGGPETTSDVHCQISHKGSGILVNDQCKWAVTLLTTGNPVPSTKPVLVYPAKERTSYIFVEGDSAQITCIFSGYPVPTVTFIASGTGSSSPVTTNEQRGIYVNGSTLRWNRITQADSNTYVCRGSNSKDWVDVELRVSVKLRPTFSSEVTRNALGFNVTVGGDLKIDCSTRADPPATVSWFINGIKSNDVPTSMPYHKRLTFVNNQTNYVLLLAAKNDNHVVQCNASNPYGYVFGSFYINVLNKTKITTRPENLTIDPNATFHSGSCGQSLTCVATADKMNFRDGTFRVTWHKATSFKPTAADFKPINMSDRGGIPRIAQTATGLCFNVDQFSPEERVSELTGTYKCRAENGVSDDEAFALIQFSNELVAPTSEGLVSTAAFDWWIVIVAAAIFLLIVIIMAVVVSVYRRRGGSYLVDQQERAQGNDPEKEMKRDGFADYIRPDQDPKKGSSASMESVKMAYDDDEESLDEFADIDHTKFGEDGSFIGQYARTHKRDRDRDVPAADEERERFANSYNYA